MQEMLHWLHPGRSHRHAPLLPAPTPGEPPALPVPTAGSVRVPQPTGSIDRRMGTGLGRLSSVLAIVPHFHAEPWLGDCLDSLARSSHPLAAIVVVDDGSGAPPTDIVRRFPQVTLIASDENVGPYRLSQEIIDHTGYDAYMFQDADDWSAPTRLERLLTEAERTGADLVGCQAYRILCNEADVVPVTYPLDVNAALSEWPTWYALLHPTSVVSRDLVIRIGGYATGLKFGGDLEFLHRAAHAARVVNIPDFAYFKRVHDGALTSRPDTGLWSRAREELRNLENERARANAASVNAGAQPDLRPMSVAASVPLSHVCGPALLGALGGRWPA